MAASTSFADYQDWRTTDDQEIERRRLRAEAGSFSIEPLDPGYPVFGDFRVRSSGSGRDYIVEIRSLDPAHSQHNCTCPDFRLNGLGTCKHCEAVLRQLEADSPREWERAQAQGSPRVEILPDPVADTLRVEPTRQRLAEEVRELFDELDLLRGLDAEDALPQLRASGTPGLRISREVDAWVEARRERRRRLELRRAYEQLVQQGRAPVQETRVSLYPYQRQGMLHLAFTQRALLADAPGLGKRAAAAAACALLHRLGEARRVLVLAPGSVLEAWRDTVREYVGTELQALGAAPGAAAGEAPVFTGVSFEQLLNEKPARILEDLQPDIVILDEAHRLRNWTSPLAQAVKAFAPVRFAFVLTGASLTSRLDELYAVMDFLNPMVLGPLFRFNRAFYVFNERGRPVDVRNLPQLRKQLAPVALRRLKVEVEAELPDVAHRIYRAPLVEDQRARCESATQAAREQLAAQSAPPTREALRPLVRSLRRLGAGMEEGVAPGQKRENPRMRELEAILHQILDEADAKVVLFSEWEAALAPVRELCERLELGHAWVTAASPERRRAMQATKFRADPECRVLLATDGVADELVLPPIGYLIHLEPPGSRATLARRHATVWRRNANFPLTAIYLTAAGTIEEPLAALMTDPDADAEQTLLAWLGVAEGGATPDPSPGGVEPALAFAQAAQKALGADFALCEERTTAQGPLYLLVVRGEAAVERAPAAVSAAWRTLHAAQPAAELEIISAEAFETLRKLTARGLVQVSSQGTRLLLQA